MSTQNCLILSGFINEPLCSTWVQNAARVFPKCSFTTSEPIWLMLFRFRVKWWLFASKVAKIRQNEIAYFVCKTEASSNSSERYKQFGRAVSRERATYGTRGGAPPYAPLFLKHSSLNLILEFHSPIAEISLTVITLITVLHLGSSSFVSALSALSDFKCSTILGIRNHSNIQIFKGSQNYASIWKVPLDYPKRICVTAYFEKPC